MDQSTVDTMIGGILSPQSAIRCCLPHRRRGYNQKFLIDGQTVYLRTGEYPDGRLGEIFIDVAKTGTLIRSLLTAVAMSVSRALQYGVPLQEFVDAYKGFGFQPAGFVEGHWSIQEAASILDLIFRDLEKHYILRERYEPPVVETPAVPEKLFGRISDSQIG